MTEKTQASLISIINSLKETHDDVVKNAVEGDIESEKECIDLNTFTSVLETFNSLMNSGAELKVGFNTIPDSLFDFLNSISDLENIPFRFTFNLPDKEVTMILDEV